MRNQIVNNLLRDADTSFRLGYRYQAHRLVCEAGRIANADRTFPIERVRAIDTARIAIAATF